MEAHSVLLTWSRLEEVEERWRYTEKKNAGTTQWNGDKFKPNDAMACAKRREARQYLDTFCQVRTDFGREDPFDNKLRRFLIGDPEITIFPSIFEGMARFGVGFTTGLRGGVCVQVPSPG